MLSKKASKVVDEHIDVDFTNLDSFGDDETEVDDLGEPNSVGIKSIRRKKPKLKGPMDVFFTPDAEKALKDRKLRQTTINETCKKELRAKACADFARWMYDVAIPFNAVKYPSFPVMIESIGQYGVGMKPPSIHEVRLPLLRQEVKKVKVGMRSYEEEWEKHGCSIMADGWTYKRQRTLINFLVNSHKGTVFIKFVDASDYSKTGEKLYELFDRMVLKIGEKNVVQFITDSAASNVLAGKLLEVKRPHLFWTPCAAHCIDLMLEDIEKLEVVSKTVKRAIKLNGYIYTRPGVVNMLRSFTGHLELVRPGITRFATTYLTLQRMHRLKANLRRMFVSDEWTKSKWAKEVAAKNASGCVLSAHFWKNVLYIMKIFGPLVRVLRLVDGEKKPPMGYIYEAMGKAKEAIAKAFDHKLASYQNIYDIIDHRWDKQLHQPLHAVGFLLNPSFLGEPDRNGEIKKGYLKALERLVESEDEQDKIGEQLILYQNSSNDLFRMKMSIRHRDTVSPVAWWETYGSCTPQLQKFALKVLGLTCSASGCERNWSTFENVHTKKRNRLAQTRMNDLVYVKYNRALKRRFDERDHIDPISLKDINDSNEWLTCTMEEDGGNDDEDLVFDNDERMWDLVSDALRVDEDAYKTRAKGKSVVSTTRPTQTYVRGGTSQARKVNPLLVSRDEEEENDDEEEEDEDDEYKDEEYKDEEEENINEIEFDDDEDLD
ncbi:uncharacterized protein [Euphorbia lathyris]|uniref:uncharacterized protein n=1 Tax=Euphorbia lathyris TaxID=212925 RepID=UPI003314495F